MRVSLDEIPFSLLTVGWLYGKYTPEGKVDFNCSDTFLSIKGTRIDWSFPETPYKFLNGASEFTLAPTALVRFPDGSLKCGYNSLSEPVNGENFGAKKAEKINAPFLDGIPLVFECKVISCNESFHHSHVSAEFDSIKYELSAEIVNVNVDDSVFVNGELCLAKALGIKWAISKDKSI